MNQHPSVDVGRTFTCVRERESSPHQEDIDCVNQKKGESKGLLTCNDTVTVSVKVTIRV